MKKTLRRRFIFFAMSAVSILLVVLIGTINIFSWVVLEQQSDDILHTLAAGDDKFLQGAPHNRGPFLPPMSMDTVKATRFFVVHTDANGMILDVNIDQISSVTVEQASAYAALVDEAQGKISTYKYEVRQHGAERLIFFMDTSSQLQTFIMVLSISCAIALLCWIAILFLLIPFSNRVIRPILAGMEKQKQFITNAGHELKTPLAIIQSNNDASSLIHGETKYSRNIRQQTQRLNTLMTNLLTPAKLDEEIRLPVERVNISAVLQGLLASYDEILLQKGIDFSADIQPDMMMQLHQDSFSQLISILLDNAAKYTPRNGRVRLTARCAGNGIEIVEENTCEPPAHFDAERLFERFYRGDTARTQDNIGSGYGIGLSAARAIAESFGGTLKADYTTNGNIRFIARF